MADATAEFYEQRHSLADDLTPIEKAERRVLAFANPGLGLNSMQATPSIFIGLQLILPGETAPNHRCCGQHSLLILVEPLEPAVNDQPHVFRNIALIECYLCAKLAGRIKDFPLLDQMPINLLDKERISLALIKDEVHQNFRSLAPT